MALVSTYHTDYFVIYNQNILFIFLILNVTQYDMASHHMMNYTTLQFLFPKYAWIAFIKETQVNKGLIVHCYNNAYVCACVRVVAPPSGRGARPAPEEQHARQWSGAKRLSRLLFSHFNNVSKCGFSSPDPLQIGRSTFWVIPWIRLRAPARS